MCRASTRAMGVETAFVAIVMAIATQNKEARRNTNCHKRRGVRPLSRASRQRVSCELSTGSLVLEAQQDLVMSSAALQMMGVYRCAAYAAPSTQLRCCCGEWYCRATTAALSASAHGVAWAQKIITHLLRRWCLGACSTMCGTLNCFSAAGSKNQPWPTLQTQCRV
jgi:hypothetical protein